METAPEDLLAYVGAGPLMNFVEPDEDRISWIEGVAATSAGFRTALTAVAVWQEEDWVVERLERETGARPTGQVRPINRCRYRSVRR